MLIKKSVLIVLLIIIAGCNIYAQSEIRFHIPNFAPYTFNKDGKIQGIGTETVDRIMKEAGIDYSLKLVSDYGIAVNEIKTGHSDGFFLASQNAERDKIAVFSKPVVINNWCWFFPADSTLNPKESNFKTKARVGTYANTNTHLWLEKNGYNVVASPGNIDELLDMMITNRINAVFLAELVFYEAIKKLGEQPDNFKKVVEVEKPFGIYISKDYLSKNPGTMEKINAAINNIAAN